jgi:transposase
MAHGVNANLARRWIFDASGDRDRVPVQDRAAETASPNRALPPSFVPVSLPASPPLSEIRVELRRGAMAISVTWPVGAASECAAWMRELLR